MLNYFGILQQRVPCRIIPNKDFNKKEGKHEIDGGNNVSMFNCSEYNEKLVMQGKILIKIVFLKDIGNELRRMNKGYSLFTFLGYLYTFIRNYRMLEEPGRDLKELVYQALS